MIMNRRTVGTVHLQRKGCSPSGFVVACGLDISVVAYSVDIDEVQCANCKRSVLYQVLRQERPEAVKPTYTHWVWTVDGD